MSNLKERITSEMLSDYRNSLEKNFEVAKKLIRITNEGKVEILNKNKFSGKELILLYCIGKQYAAEAGLTKRIGVTNKELQDELSIPLGSILPWLKNLRSKKKINQDKTITPNEHYVPLNYIEPILKELEIKVQS